MYHRLPSALLCLVLSTAARAQPAALPAPDDKLAQARALYQEIHTHAPQHQPDDPKQALAKGLTALSLLGHATPPDPDPTLDLQLRDAIAQLRLRAGDVAGAIAAMQEAIARAQYFHDSTMRHYFQIRLASTRLDTGDDDGAVALAGASLHEAQIAHDTESTIGALEVLGNAASKSGDFPQAIQYLHQALQLAPADARYRRATLLDSLAKFYMDAHEWENARAANQEAQAITRAIPNQRFLSSLLFTGYVIDSFLHKTDEELTFLDEAEKIGQDLHDNDTMILADINRSDVLLSAQKYAQSLDRSAHALALIQSSGMTPDMQEDLAVTHVNHGTALNHLGHHADGLKEIEQGVQFYVTNRRRADATEMFGALSDEYAYASDFKQALYYLKKYKSDSDLIYHDDRMKSLQDLEMRYQAEKRDVAILDLANQARRRRIRDMFDLIWGLLGVGLIIAVVGRYRLLHRQSAQLRVLNHQLAHQSLTDPLTGLPNRRFFFQHIDAYISEHTNAPAGPGRRVTDHRRCLIFYLIDLDHFKSVNDTYGHHAGDLVLQQAVARLRGVVRDQDTLVRWGGEEFLFVARHASWTDAPLVAERLRTAINRAPFDLGSDGLLHRTCSIGFAGYPLLRHEAAQPAWETVMALADQALYQAKSAGRNGWVGAAASDQATFDLIAAHCAAGLQTLVHKNLCRLQTSFSPAQLKLATDG